jgi:prepilin-type N-terminal cleavage/methylation domain-containing protein
VLPSKPYDQNGFTIVELIVVVTVLAAISVVFLGLTSSYLITLTRNNQLTEMTISSQNLLRTTVESLRFGDGVRQTNQISDPNAPSGGWNTNNTSFVIIIAEPALDSSKEYIIDPVTGSPYMNELVYYKDGDTLMKRKLANPAATGNRLVTSCPANLASASCPADIKLAEYVKSMVFTLYDQDGSNTNVAADAQSVNIALDMERNSLSNKPLKLTTSIRVTLRNRF